MSFVDSILTAAFCWSVVFLVLAVLFGLIRLFSLVLSSIASKAAKPVETPAAPTPVQKPESVKPEDDFSAGELKLKDVDEQTAAMIMAIVSDESGIPLSELCFKSITLVTK